MPPDPEDVHLGQVRRQRSTLQADSWIGFLLAHTKTHTHKKNKHRPLGISLYENIIKHFGSNPKRVNVTWAVSKTFWKIPNNTSLVIRYEQKLWEFPDNDQSTRCVLQNHCIEAATLDCKRLIEFINTKRKNHQNTLRKHYLRNLGARNCL